MKKSRYTDSQITYALKRVEAGIVAPDLCRLGISSATFYKSCVQYGGMAHRLMKELAEENDASSARVQKST
jgi:putative transposase